MNLNSVFQLQETIFILMLIGALIKKCGIVSDEGQKTLLDVVIYLALPCSIIKSFQIGPSFELLQNFALILVITIIFLLVSMAVGELLFYKKVGSRKVIMKYGVICSNAGILGNAVAEGIFSDMGILYASVALVPVRAFMWGVGLSYFSEKVGKGKMALRIAMHPCIIAVIIGLVLMLTSTSLPGFISRPLDSIAQMSSTLATISVGTVLADVKFSKLIDYDTMYISLVRLIVIPLLVWVICYFCQYACR